MRFDRFKILWSMSVMSVFVGTLFLLLSGDEAGSATAEQSRAPTSSAPPAVGDSTAASATPSAAESAAKKTSESSESRGAVAAAETTSESEATTIAAPPEPPKRAPASAGGCLLDENALEDLKQKRSELAAKAHELAQKENELKAAKTALEEELKKISAVRDEIEKMQSLNKKDQEEKVGKLVEAFETMSPKAAAQLLASIDEVLAVEAMGRISTQKLAKIMNIMDPGALSKLTEKLAGVTQAKKLASHGALEVTSESKKGGEKNDGQNQPSTQTAPEPTSKLEPVAQKVEGSR